MMVLLLKIVLMTMKKTVDVAVDVDIVDDKDTLVGFNNVKNIPVNPQVNYIPIKSVIKKEEFYNPKTTFEIGDKIDLGQFLYDSDNPIYINVFEEEFNELYKLMKAKPNLRIEVSGHTDSSGTAEYNLKLSKFRSQSIVDALVVKGIDKSRLVSKGYGSTVPVAPNTTPEGKPDQIGMKLNRRVELRVIDN